jgi:hypothetical protein
MDKNYLLRMIETDHMDAQYLHSSFAMDMIDDMRRTMPAQKYSTFAGLDVCQWGRHLDRYLPRHLGKALRQKKLQNRNHISALKGEK